MDNYSCWKRGGGGGLLDHPKPYLLMKHDETKIQCTNAKTKHITYEKKNGNDDDDDVYNRR